MDNNFQFIPVRLITFIHSGLVEAEKIETKTPTCYGPDDWILVDQT